MRILVAGQQGQLARALLGQAQGRSGFDVVALGRPQLDLLDKASIARAIDAVRPDLVVNAAAYTSVDKAETCLLYTSPSPRDGLLYRMPSSA